MAEQNLDDTGDAVWHVTIPAIALVRAADPRTAEAAVAAALASAGFHPFEEGRVVFASEPVEGPTTFEGRYGRA